MISYVLAIILGYWVLNRARKAGAEDEKARILERLLRHPELEHVIHELEDE